LSDNEIKQEFVESINKIFKKPCCGIGKIVNGKIKLSPIMYSNISRKYNSEKYNHIECALNSIIEKYKLHIAY
jgi:hypothetical protein